MCWTPVYFQLMLCVCEEETIMHWYFYIIYDFCILKVYYYETVLRVLFYKVFLLFNT